MSRQRSPRQGRNGRAHHPPPSSRTPSDLWSLRSAPRTTASSTGTHRAVVAFNGGERARCPPAPIDAPRSDRRKRWAAPDGRECRGSPVDGRLPGREEGLERRAGQGSRRFAAVVGTLRTVQPDEEEQLRIVGRKDGSEGGEIGALFVLVAPVRPRGARRSALSGQPERRHAGARSGASSTTSTSTGAARPHPPAYRTAPGRRPVKGVPSCRAPRG